MKLSDASEHRTQADERVVEHRRALYSALVFRNTFAPISFLPPELLCIIFHHYVELSVNPSRLQIDCRVRSRGTRYRSLLTLSHVSTAWRTFILTTDILWSTVDVIPLMDAQRRSGTAFLLPPAHCPLVVNVDFGLSVYDIVNSVGCSCYNPRSIQLEDGGMEWYVDSRHGTRPSCTTLIMRYMKQHILPLSCNLTVLNIQLPLSAILHLLSTLHSKSDSSLESLVTLKISIISRSADLEPTSQSLLGKMPPIQLRNLRSLFLLDWPECIQKAQALLAPLDAPSASCQIRCWNTIDIFNAYLPRSAVPNNHPQMSYTLRWCNYDEFYFLPHETGVGFSSISVPSISLHSMWDHEAFESVDLGAESNSGPLQGVISSLLTTISGFQTHRNAILTRFEVHVHLLFEVLCSMLKNFEDYASFEDDKTFVEDAAEENEWIVSDVEKVRKPTGNPLVDRFIIAWCSLLEGMPTLECLCLDGISGFEMSHDRPSLIMPLLLSVSLQTTWASSDSLGIAPTIRVQALKTLHVKLPVHRLNHTIKRTRENDSDDAASNLTCGMFSWLENTLRSRYEHGVPITQLNVEMLDKAGCESCSPAVEKLVRKEVFRVKEAVDGCGLQTTDVY